jgi:hypothetical protein
MGTNFLMQAKWMKLNMLCHKQSYYKGSKWVREREGGGEEEESGREEEKLVVCSSRKEEMTLFTNDE